MIISNINGKIYKSLIGFTRHCYCNNLTVLNYFIKYENLKFPKCKCGENLKFKKFDSNFTPLFTKTCRSKICISKSYKKHTEETKNKLSLIRKKYLENNKNKHNWSIYRKKETEPEKKFREIISKIDINYKIYQWYIPENGYKNYEIDFAIPELKIGFEINGNQHYNKDGSFTEYHLKRKKYLENLNWNIVDIHYLICFDVIRIKTIINNSLNNNFDFLELLNLEIINHINFKKEKKELLKIENNSIKKIKREVIIENKKRIILDSNIDFKKFGWVSKVAKLLNCKHQKVNMFMKENLLEFYMENCFKRIKKNKFNII